MDFVLLLLLLSLLLLSSPSELSERLSHKLNCDGASIGQEVCNHLCVIAVQWKGPEGAAIQASPDRTSGWD